MRIRNKKGFISIYVMLAMIFFITFVTIALINASRKLQLQTETNQALLEVYKNDNKGRIQETKSIPVYTKSEFIQVLNWITQNKNGEETGIKYINTNNQFYKLDPSNNWDEYTIRLKTDIYFNLNEEDSVEKYKELNDIDKIQLEGHIVYYEVSQGNYTAIKNLTLADVNGTYYYEDTSSNLTYVLILNNIDGLDESQMKLYNSNGDLVKKLYGNYKIEYDHVIFDELIDSDDVDIVYTTKIKNARYEFIFNKDSNNVGTLDFIYFSAFYDLEGDENDYEETRTREDLAGTIFKNGWEQNKDVITRGDQTVHVGDLITNYNVDYPVQYLASGLIDTENKEDEWAVLGAELGKLLITTAKDVAINSEDKNNNTVSGLYLYGWPGIESAVATIDGACGSYLNNQYGTKVRNVKGLDLNRITGYSPTSQRYGRGMIREYGNKVTFYKDVSSETLPEGTTHINLNEWAAESFRFYTAAALEGDDENGVPYTNISSSTSVANNQFTKMDTGYVTIEASAYAYGITTNEIAGGEIATVEAASSTPTTIMQVSEKVFDLILESNTPSMGYWLSDDMQMFFHDASENISFPLEFTLSIVQKNMGQSGYGNIGSNHSPYSSSGSQNEFAYNIKPVVYIKRDIKLLGDSENGWALSNN